MPGTEGISPNGIEVSPDGAWYYVGGWGTETFFRVSRGEDPWIRQDLPVGVHIDNVHFDNDGNILVAGHEASVAAVIDCLVPPRVCQDITSKVWRVSPDLVHHEEIFSYPTNERLALGTAAIQVHSEIWVGGLSGEQIAVIPAR